MDCSPPGSSVHGIFQARVLEWVAIPFSRGSSQPRDQTHVSCTADGILSHLSHAAQTQVLSKYFIQLTQGLHDCALDQIFYKHTCLSPTPACFKVSCVREICFYFCLARVLWGVGHSYFPCEYFGKYFRAREKTDSIQQRFRLSW